MHEATQATQRVDGLRSPQAISLHRRQTCFCQTIYRCTPFGVLAWRRWNARSVNTGILSDEVPVSVQQRSYSFWPGFSDRGPRHASFEFGQAVKRYKALHVVDARGVRVKRGDADIENLREIAHRQAVNAVPVGKNTGFQTNALKINLHESLLSIL